MGGAGGTSRSLVLRLGTAAVEVACTTSSLLRTAIQTVSEHTGSNACDTGEMSIILN